MNHATIKKLGFGTMRLPLTDPENPRSVDLTQFKRMVDLYLARGFCYFDTAYPYHGEYSEDAVRQALTERYPRESFVLADKMPILRVKAPEDYDRFFAEQLRRCGVSYFDVYLLHNLGRDRYPNAQRFGAFPFLMRLKEQGLVKSIGFSFHDDAETLDRILTDHPEVDVVQLQINYLDWNAAVAQSGRCYETAARHGKKVIVMEPVKGGILANLPEPAMRLFTDFYGSAAPSPASLAIRYAASLEQVKVVLSGMSTPEQVDDNTAYMQDFMPLTEPERDLTKQIEETLNRALRVPCTGCRYCMEVCPKNIAIPDYFGLLNLHAVTGQKTNMYYQRYAMNRGKASECLQCGLCEKNCPQHIAIRDMLKEFSALYEGVTG
ncbi:MAG: aldo/keto reductase [Clostridia bacterium]|nr:aldo/keto reductase [Clostridia bacterium]